MSRLLYERIQVLKEKPLMMLDVLKQCGDLGGPLFQRLVTLFNQLELPPVQESHEEQVLARLEIDLEVLLLDSVAYREELNDQLGGLRLRLLVLLQRILHLHLDMLPVLVKEHEPVLNGHEPVLVGDLDFKDYMLMRTLLIHTFRVELHDLLSEIVHEGRLLHEVHEYILDLCNDRALNDLMEDLEGAMIG